MLYTHLATVQDFNEKINIEALSIAYYMLPYATFF